MTSGRGISHSEVSTPDTATLHGVQLWVALPDATRHVAPAFEHYAPEAVTGDGFTARVFLGDLLGDSSPVRTHTELLGAEILLDAGATLTLDVAEHFEHGVLLDEGGIEVEGCPVAAADLGYLAPGRTTLGITAQVDSRLILLGGPPFGESIIMWWNFVGRSHEEIVESRRQWQEQIVRDGAVVTSGLDVADGLFGTLPDQPLPPIPAPPMPNARLRERR
ncbi:pirin family protein [Nocardioides alcanivorans]|uniref:pirin family protein n=1 Tax=Nocardioides alcanivorans TaxID=2897352 RepID=UPI001F3D08D3|nr:pirin-like C-terminal cupin domain-containing protein [Nocardioides alcanivorans]